MENEYALSVKLQQWATVIQKRGLVDVVTPFLDVLQAWGFVGGQMLWMIAPFVGEEKLAPFAEALERPEAFRAFRQYLNEGEARQ